MARILFFGGFCVDTAAGAPAVDNKVEGAEINKGNAAELAKQQQQEKRKRGTRALGVMTMAEREVEAQLGRQVCVCVCVCHCVCFSLIASPVLTGCPMKRRQP